MKSVQLTLLLFICFITTIAQPPQLISWQGVLRDPQNNILANDAIDLRFEIRSISNNALVMREEHSVTTNGLGLVNLEIGGGLALYGDISDIEWGDDDYSLTILLDYNLTGNFSVLGTTQLLSVPYALYSEEAGYSSGMNDITPNHPDGASGVGISGTSYTVPIDSTLYIFTLSGELAYLTIDGTQAARVGSNTETPSHYKNINLIVDGGSVVSGGFFTGMLVEAGVTVVNEATSYTVPTGQTLFVTTVQSQPSANIRINTLAVAYSVGNSIITFDPPLVVKEDETIEAEYITGYLKDNN